MLKFPFLSVFLELSLFQLFSHTMPGWKEGSGRLARLRNCLEGQFHQTFWVAGLTVFFFSSVWMREPAGHDTHSWKHQQQIKLNLLKAKSSAKWRFVLATLLYIKQTFTRSLVPFVFPWVLHRSDLFALFPVLLPHPYPFHIAHVVFCFRPFLNLTLSTFSS